MTTHEIITPKAQLPVYFDIYTSNNLFIPSHWHAHLEIIYMFRGTMDIGRNDEKYTLHKNDLFVVNSGDIHYTRSTGNAEVLLLQIPYEFLNQSMQQYNTLQFKEYFPHSEFKEETAFQKMVEQLLFMRKHYELGEEGYQFLFSSNLYLFLHILYTHYSMHQNLTARNKDAKHLMRLQEIIAYVDQHYMEPLTLTDAAALVALNPEYFCRSFKKYMGFSFLKYVNQVRLTHIHRDILETDDSITNIQERNGFSNYKVFNRMFKEAYGCSPSKLKSHQK
jgi:AraC-like DNA-binding protein